MNLSNTPRSKLPFSAFGDPANRKYPLNTPGRARNAPARASEMQHKGVISKRKEDSIDARANRALDHMKHARSAAQQRKA